MIIDNIHLHRRDGNSHLEWTVSVIDPEYEFYNWLMTTFPDLYRKSTGKTWDQTWKGKQYHNKGKAQYRIKGSEIMSMVQLRWS